jgi:hypothetical protein
MDLPSPIWNGIPHGYQILGRRNSLQTDSRTVWSETISSTVEQTLGYLDEYLRSTGFQSFTRPVSLYIVTEKCLRSGKADPSFVPTKLDKGNIINNHDNVVYISWHMSR